MPPEHRSSLSVSVLCWDLGHNALGRAHLLADMLAADHDVEIVGSHFPEFGSELWTPLRDTGIRVRRYPGGPFPDHFETMERMARELTADVVYVVKPRLPGLGVGFLAKVEAGRPLMVDCDDLELSFVGAERGISLDELTGLAAGPDLLRPQGRTWTSFSEWAVRFADRVTVSNVPLAARYGGSVIPHARDETIFDPERYDREEARARLGLTEEHRVVLFAGTPRRHKGIQQIAAALDRIGDRRNRLCVLDTRELDQLRAHLSGLQEWIHPVAPEPFSRLPQLLTAADLVCLLQDPASETARWQMPAKVSDALAMGVPCLTTRMPPLLPLIEEGGLVPVTEDDLDVHLESMLTDEVARVRQARRGREIFLRRLSYSAVRPRLEETLRSAAARNEAPSPDLMATVSFQRSAFGRAPAPAPAFTEVHEAGSNAGAPARPERGVSRDSTVLAVVPYLQVQGQDALHRCLSSLVVQTRPPDGIVVVDDASAAPPVEVVRRFRGVTLLRSRQEAGPDRLIEQVVGDTAADWYLLQEADGWSTPDRLERLLAGASESGADGVDSDCIVVAAAEGLTARARPPRVSLVRRPLGKRGGRAGDDVAHLPRVLHFQRHRPEPVTTPSAVGAPPIALDHLCGPTPTPLRRAPVARAAVRRAVRRLRGELRRPPAPTLVFGAPASGADTVQWSLAQHPSLVPLSDLSWCAPAAEVVARAAGRPGPLDGVGATPEDVRRALAASLATVVSRAGGQRSGWVAHVAPTPEFVRALLVLFPDAHLLHVVRDADEAVAALTTKSVAVAEPLPLAEAYPAWLAGVRGGLDCERVAGAGRVLRVRFGELVRRPEEVLGECLRFVGVGEHPACARLLEGVELAALPRRDSRAPGAVAAEARDLSTALCGPPVLVRGPARTPLTPPPRADAPAPPREAARTTPAPGPPPLPPHVAQPAALLKSAVPPGAVVAVVTKGESRFLELEDMEVWHFPRTAEGEWAGYHPKDTAEILRHLADLRRRGALYLLIPSYVSWWLEHYEGLRERLLATGSLVAESRAAGSLFALGPKGLEGGVEPAPERRPHRVQSAADGFDVVMFWKQHDSGLYGRRHDMLMRHLARSPRVGQVVQFDAPVDLAALRRRDPEVPTHNGLLEELAMARIEGVETLPGLHQHSFVYGGGRRGDRELPTRDEYAVYVKDALARHGVGERPVVFWVYPHHFEFPDIARAFGPDLVVADVVDDHRTWLRRGGGEEQRVLRNYEAIAGSADVVLVNCEPMREVMAGMGAAVHLVPNAADYPDPLAGAPLEVPEELRSLDGPILGYVGNLSSRIDVDLLDHLASERRDWNLVLIGSAHAGRSIVRLARHPNVALLGPRPYEEAKRFVRAFDVALIPHLDDAMTRAMNPLKAFVYCALQVPVVSTDISNLGELRPLISVASDHADFLARVDGAIRAGRPPIGPAADAVLRRNSWESRTRVITALLDEAFRRRAVDR